MQSVKILWNAWKNWIIEDKMYKNYYIKYTKSIKRYDKSIVTNDIFVEYTF